MKKATGSALTIVALLITLTSLEAQTNTNVLSSTNVLYQSLNLNISLTATTNGIVETNGNLVTSKPGNTKITSKTIISLLDSKVVFPLGKRMHIDGYAIPDLGAGVMTNFSKNAKLMFLQGLATNHGAFFVIIRDGKPSVDYDVSIYFRFDRQRFLPAIGDTVTTYNLNLDDGSDNSTELYLGELEFDNNAFEPSTNKIAFEVAGPTTARKSPVLDNGVTVDPSAVRSLSSQVSGTGILGAPEAFAVLRGSINANGPKLVVD